jgi:hypothetical protein
MITREFSICLLADKKTTSFVNSWRKKLLPSPYRDDPPHITLLRGITSPHQVEDIKLYEEVGGILESVGVRQLDLAFENVCNVADARYTDSAVVYFDLPESISTKRSALIAELQAHNFSIEPDEITSYEVHMTLRLGVSLTMDQIQSIRGDCTGKSMGFTDMALFRLELQKDRRMMHVVNSQG